MELPPIPLLTEKPMHQNQGHIAGKAWEPYLVWYITTSINIIYQVPLKSRHMGEAHSPHLKLNMAIKHALANER